MTHTATQNTPDELAADRQPLALAAGEAAHFLIAHARVDALGEAEERDELLNIGIPLVSILCVLCA